MRLITALGVCLLAVPALAQDQQCWENDRGTVCIPLGNNIRVIDGDTFEMDGEIIRLWGIDAPELDQTCNAPGQYGALIDGDVATMASIMLAAGLSSGVSCDAMGSSYGRTVARCLNGSGYDVADQQVLAGLAFDYLEYSEGFYAETQQRAQDYGDGIWAPGTTCEPPWEWREGD